MATSTVPETRRGDGGPSPRFVVRYRRAARLVHTATYLVTFVLLATGWWLRAGREGQESFLARLLGWSDVTIHKRAGWALVVVLGIACTFGVRAVVTFVRETLRVDRGDGSWFLRWPRGALTGRFARHRGHFDPGQRLLNLAFVATFGVLIVTGIGLTTIHGGPEFAALARLHLVATYVLTGLVVAHVLVAVGVLPGYRGAWRSMHLGGRAPVATVHRLWPRSAEADDPPGGEPEPRVRRT